MGEERNSLVREFKFDLMKMNLEETEITLVGKVGVCEKIRSVKKVKKTHALASECPVLTLDLIFLAK